MDKLFQESLKPLKYKGSIDGFGARLGMIIRFYFPDLLQDYQKFLKVYQNVAEKTMQLDDKIVLESKRYV